MDLAPGEYTMLCFVPGPDGKPQVIKSFRHEDIPISLGIVIDNSGSMREKRDKVNKSAINLVKSSNPEDQVFVVNFAVILDDFRAPGRGEIRLDLRQFELAEGVLPGLAHQADDGLPAGGGRSGAPARRSCR